MITVKGRELIIPEGERYIGTPYDNNSEIRTFQIDRTGMNGVDLSALSFRLDLEYKGGKKDTALLEKTIDEEKIVLLWNIAKGVLQEPGTLFANVRATDTQGSVKWASFPAAMYVEKTIDTPSGYNGSLTELEQLETRIDKKMEEMDNWAGSVDGQEEIRQKNEQVRQNQEEIRQKNEIEREKKTQEVINTFGEAIGEAKDAAKLSESWAVGETGIRPGENENNSKYYCSQSQAEADRAKEEADKAAAFSEIVPPVFCINWETMELIQETAATGIRFFLTEDKELCFEFTKEEQGGGEDAAADHMQIWKNKDDIQKNQTDIAALTDKTNTLAPGIALGAKGGTIAVDDAAELPPQGLTVYGRSEQLVTTGAQLLNPALYDKDKTVNGVTFTKQADGSVILTGKSTGTSTFYLGEYVDVLEDGKTYIYGSGSPLGVINITYNDGTSNGYLNVITVDKSRMVSIKPYIQFSIEKPAPNNIRILPMFNEGTVIKPWEPYSGGKPSPSMEYPQEVVSAGDNGSITVEVTGRNFIKPNSYGTYYELPLKANTVVTLMTNGKLSDGGNIKFVATDGSDVWFSIDKGQTRVCRSIGNKDVKGFYNLLGMSAGLEYMFAVGNIKTYTPYVDPQSLTLATPNGLPGIPVKSGGNYTDSAGQQWVCDEIDLSEEERVRRIDIFERVTFTIHPNYEVEGSQLFRSDIKINDDELSGIQLPCMCNKMMKAPTVLIENKTGFYAAYGRIFARIKDVSDADTFNQMMADNVFLVQRPDPIVTPLSPEEIAAYRALHTYAPNTTITNDAGCGMFLTYIADTQRYIDKKIAAISAAE